MKTTFQTLAVALAFLAISCGQSHDHSGSAPNNSASNAGGKDTVHAYVCPMRCEGSGSMNEGLCSVCSMDLGTNPDFPGHESMAIGEEPAEGAAMVDSTMVAEEQQHSHENHEGHSH